MRSLSLFWVSNCEIFCNASGRIAAMISCLFSVDAADSATATERGFPTTTGSVVPGNKTTSRRGSSKLVSILLCRFKNREVAYVIKSHIRLGFGDQLMLWTYSEKIQCCYGTVLQIN